MKTSLHIFTLLLVLPWTAGAKGNKATKCDLCVENHGGPAYQHARPHGTLERMNLNSLDALSKWLKL
jgi:hypothetical protein